MPEKKTPKPKTPKTPKPESDAKKRLHDDAPTTAKRI